MALGPCVHMCAITPVKNTHLLLYHARAIIFDNNSVFQPCYLFYVSLVAMVNNNNITELWETSSYSKQTISNYFFSESNTLCVIQCWVIEYDIIKKLSIKVNNWPWHIKEITKIEIIFILCMTNFLCDVIT